MSESIEQTAYRWTDVNVNEMEGFVKIQVHDKEPIVEFIVYKKSNNEKTRKMKNFIREEERNIIMNAIEMKIKEKYIEEWKECVNEWIKEHTTVTEFGEWVKENCDRSEKKWMYIRNARDNKGNKMEDMEKIYEKRSNSSNKIKDMKFVIRIGEGSGTYTLNTVRIINGKEVDIHWSTHSVDTGKMITGRKYMTGNLVETTTDKKKIEDHVKCVFNELKKIEKPIWDEES